MHGEDLLVDDGSNRKAVEAVGEGLPQLDVVPSLALVVEAVDAVDRGALVVAAQNEEVLGVFNLVCEEQANGLKGLLATVYVVAEEEVVGLWWETAIFEETEQVVVLAVNITANLVDISISTAVLWHVVRASGLHAGTNLYGCLELEEDGLRDEDLSCLGAQIADLSLEQLHLLAGPAASDFEEPVYDRVQIYLVFRHSCDWLLARVLGGVARENLARQRRGNARRWSVYPSSGLSARMQRQNRRACSAAVRAALPARASPSRQLWIAASTATSAGERAAYL